MRFNYKGLAFDFNSSTTRELAKVLPVSLMQSALDLVENVNFDVDWGGSEEDEFYHRYFKEDDWHIVPLENEETEGLMTYLVFINAERYFRELLLWAGDVACYVYMAKNNYKKCGLKDIRKVCLSKKSLTKLWFEEIEKYGWVDFECIKVQDLLNIFSAVRGRGIFLCKSRKMSETALI